MSTPEMRLALEHALTAGAQPRRRVGVSFHSVSSTSFDMITMRNPMRWTEPYSTAQRAVELDATSQLGYLALAQAHYYRRDLSAFRPAADRVLSLNPRDTMQCRHDWPSDCVWRRLA